MMPWRLLAFIVVMTMVLVFIGFNLDNRCDISLAFFTFSDVPVIITILSSFLLGLLMAFPLSFVHKPGKQPNRRKRGSGTQRTSVVDEKGPSFGVPSSGVPSSTSRKTGYKAAATEESFDED